MKKMLILLIFLQSAVSFAQWNNDPAINTIVCATPSHQLAHQMIPDGNGGAIITWVETQDLNIGRIHAQHISSEGNLLWPSGGIAVSPASESHTIPHIISDGNDGAIISWLDNKNGVLNSYVQKISATGQLQWPAGGIAVCPAAKMYNFSYKMLSDGNGGAIIIWDDNRAVVSQVFSQRISGAGSVIWQADGVPCSPLNVPGSVFDAVTDTATGGFFLCWPRVTGITAGNDIFVQRISGDGALTWEANGINICTAPKDQLYNKIISDGNGGIIVLWQDFREDPVLSQIYGNRVGAEGTLYWNDNGNKICDSIVPASTLFLVVSDGSGGGIVAWLDDFIADQTTTSNLHALRFNAAGATLWPGNKVAGWEDTYYLSPFQMVTDTRHGSFITWHHASNSHPVGDEARDIYNVYGQHIFSDGLTRWADSGTLVSSAPLNQYNPQIVSGDNGVAITAWTDTRSATNYDIYAARLVGDITTPVEWLSFTAQKDGNSHVLSWKIAGEINNKGFYIERSRDGTHFESIGFVSGSGSSSQAQAYFFKDTSPLRAGNYYRLKQVDFDGRFKYSKILRLDMSWQEELSVYPNPVSTVLKIKSNTSNVVLHILNPHGAVVKITKTSAAGVTELNTSDLPAGLYYIKIKTGRDAGTVAGKFVKQ